MTVRIVPCGSERAEEVHLLTQAAFAPYHDLDPPSGALQETMRSVAEDLRLGGGAIAERAGEAIGCLRWRPTEDGDLYVWRLAVRPDAQRQGVGRELMTWAETEARERECGGVSVGVRNALLGNIEFYQRLGYAIVGEEHHEGYAAPTGLSMRKTLRVIS